MSWKNIKDHYQIGHHVQIIDGKICIGSGYCPKLIMVSLDGKLSLGPLGVSSNEDLERYYEEMKKDPAKLKELAESEDTFETSLTVYTYKGGDIVEKQCEEYGYPNVTHDGMMQYENNFSADKDKVVAWAKRNAELGVKYGKEHVEDAEKRLAEKREYLSNEIADLAKLNADYPDIQAES